MLRAGRMEEFVTEEEEPWYDQRDLEQGEHHSHPSHHSPFIRLQWGDVTMHSHRLSFGISFFIFYFYYSFSNFTSDDFF